MGTKVNTLQPRNRRWVSLTLRSAEARGDLGSERRLSASHFDFLAALLTTTLFRLALGFVVFETPWFLEGDDSLMSSTGGIFSGEPSERIGSSTDERGDDDGVCLLLRASTFRSRIVRSFS